MLARSLVVYERRDGEERGVDAVEEHAEEHAYMCIYVCVYIYIYIYAYTHILHVLHICNICNIIIYIYEIINTCYMRVYAEEHAYIIVCYVIAGIRYYSLFVILFYTIS